MREQKLTQSLLQCKSIGLSLGKEEELAAQTHAQAKLWNSVRTQNGQQTKSNKQIMNSSAFLLIFDSWTICEPFGRIKVQKLNSRRVQLLLQLDGWRGVRQHMIHGNKLNDVARWQDVCVPGDTESLANHLPNELCPFEWVTENSSISNVQKEYRCQQMCSRCSHCKYIQANKWHSQRHKNARSTIFGSVEWKWFISLISKSLSAFNGSHGNAETPNMMNISRIMILWTWVAHARRFLLTFWCQ